MGIKDFKGIKKISHIKDLYKIVKILGEGQYGTVRMATHKQLGYDCAIKIIKKKLLAKSLITEDLMQNELAALCSLSHPSMIRIYELLATDGKYYIVSE